MPVMRNKTLWSKGYLVNFDDTSYETLQRGNALYFYDDFLGTAVLADGTTMWNKKDTGAATEAILANGVGGVYELALTNGDEKQEAGLYFGDTLNFDITKGLIWEARVNITVLPTLLAEAQWGLASAYVEGWDNISYSVGFDIDGNGAVNLSCDDNTTDSLVSSGTTILADAYHIYRIDCSDVTKIRYYIDGVEQAASSTIPFAATGSNAKCQPYLYIYKAAGAGVGTMDVDYVRIWQNRS